MRPVVSIAALELHGEPFQCHGLEVLQKPLGGNDLIHQDGDVLVDGLMGIRLVRRLRQRLPDALAPEPGSMADENFELFSSQRVAEAPRRTRVRTLLDRQQALECRDVAVSHVEVNQPLSRP